MIRSLVCEDDEAEQYIPIVFPNLGADMALFGTPC